VVAIYSRTTASFSPLTAQHSIASLFLFLLICLDLYFILFCV
jgi:hypothetical protein